MNVWIGGSDSPRSKPKGSSNAKVVPNERASQHGSTPKPRRDDSGACEAGLDSSVCRDEHFGLAVVFSDGPLQDACDADHDEGDNETYTRDDRA